MARSLLATLVRGTRQMLMVQLLISIVVIAVAAWTLAIMTNVTRERDQLRARVVQLETAMGAQGVVVPAKPATVDPTAISRDATAYPPPVGALQKMPAGVQVVAFRRGAAAEPAPQGFDPTRVIRAIFTPPPPMRALVIHVRGAADAGVAERIARAMQGALSVIIDVLPEHDQRPSGYAYFDGRQSLAAAALVSRFNDAARQATVAAWSAQLPGIALPAQGEYRADRVDIVLPALPAPAPPPVAAAAPAPPVTP
jgi:hypothetical protein